MNKNFISVFLMVLISVGAIAQSFSDIVLPAPVKTGGKPLMEA